jgi:phenylalanyl-tRNA synthetase beta chain
VEEAILEASKFVTNVQLFDVYVGAQIPPSKRSMAFTLTFRPGDEELTDEKVDGYVNKILRKLKSALDIDLRT